MRSAGTGIAAGEAIALAETVPGQPAPVAPARPPERFIPVARAALRERLFRAKGWSGEDERAWRGALHCLAAWRHHHYRERLSALLERYLPFSPDSDTAHLTALGPVETERAGRELIASIEALLVRANYTRISEAGLERLLRERSPYGLRLEVDLDEYEHMLLYYRGAGVETREERDPWRLYLARTRFQVPVFERLFLLVKLKSESARLTEIMDAQQVGRDEARKILRRRRGHLPPRASSDHIYLKIFKRIPQIDLEMMFPNTRVAFRPLDKLQLGLTAGGGTVAGAIGSVTKLMAASNPFALAGALVGLCALVFRQVTKFFHTRNRYMMMLAQNLYFHNLANNRGALTLLVDRAEEEDAKEDMLLYAWLAERPVPPAELPELKRGIEEFLARDCGVSVAFDAEDALRRLIADGLVQEADGGRLRAIPPREARRHLDRLWDRLLDEDTLDQVAARARG